jgi:hypothetical protein
MPSKKLTPKQITSIHHQANNGVSVVALCAKYNLSSSHIYRIKNNEQRNRKKTTTMEKYNGWTNDATWLFYLHHQQEVENWYQDHDEEMRKNLDYTDMESYFEEMYGELIDGIANIYLTDVIGNEMRTINWNEVLNTLREDDEPIVDNWTEEGAITNYLDHVAENKDRERN